MTKFPRPSPPGGLEASTGALPGCPLRIAILGSRGFPSTYGGYETLVRHLAPAWASQGHDVTVYCRGDERAPTTQMVQGVRCIRTFGLDTKSASTLSFGLTSHLHAAFMRYDVALVLNVANGFFLPLLAARQIPTVLNTDGLEWKRGKWGPSAQRVFYRGAKLSARFADVLVSDSNAIADVWAEEFQLRPRFIPYGADVEVTVPDARVRDLGLTPSRYVLSVARLIPENNVELTLDALDHMPQRPQAIIVGSANYRSPLETRLRSLDADGKIRWLGHVSDQELLRQLWAHCGAYVHGHSVGGTNPALLQALGWGAPTLALDTPFNDEVISRKEQLYPPDSQVLAHKLDGLLRAVRCQEEYSRHGRAVVGERFQWHEVCDAYERALRDAQAIRVGTTSAKRRPRWGTLISQARRSVSS